MRMNRFCQPFKILVPIGNKYERIVHVGIGRQEDAHRDTDRVVVSAVQYVAEKEEEKW